MRRPIEKLHPYTLGFSLAVREIADGQRYPQAVHAAQEVLNAAGYQQFVLGFLDAHDLDRELEEAVSL